MEPKNAAQHVVERRDTQKSQRRASFSPMKAIRSLSISSQISQLSTASDPELSPASPAATPRRRMLRKGWSSETPLRKDDLLRKPSKSSAEDSADHRSVSTRPTSPSATGSRGTSISGDVSTVIKSGPLQAEASLLKPKKEYLVLTPAALMKFKSRNAAAEQWPQIDSLASVSETVSPVESQTSFKASGHNADVWVPLERIISVFNDEGTRPSFGIELWWRGEEGAYSFTCLQLDFRLPDDRDDWLKQIRVATRHRIKSLWEDRVPAEIELHLNQILDAKYKEKDAPAEIYPIIPRRPYARLRANAGEVRKNWREASSFYLAFSKYSIYLAQFSQSATGAKVNPDLVHFGLVTLARVSTNMNDERFDLVFRIPLDQPKKVELSSRYHRAILSKLFRADTYLKPAWPLWTRREVFLVDGEAQQTPLPNGEDYGGFKSTLEAFLEGYHCPYVNWTVRWKNVRFAPEFCLLPPKCQTRYTAHQLLAVFRALRFNDFFKSLSFCNVDFSTLSGVSDNAQRLESTVWLSRSGRRSLTRTEFELLENSPVLFQELVSLMLGSESIKHMDLSNVLGKAQRSIASYQQPEVCEIMPPLILLWKSSQTRCYSVILNGNAVGQTDIVELCRVLQNHPDFLKVLSLSRCHLGEGSLIDLWDGLHEQRSSIETIDLSYNSGSTEASRISDALDEAGKIKRLNLAYTIKGHLDGPLFRPWSQFSSFQPWRLEELDLSGWKINFDTLCMIMRYLEFEESRSLRRLILNNCGLSGSMATGILCRVGGNRNVHLSMSENPLEVGSTDWIDLIHGNEAPRMLHLDMIQFQHVTNFNRLLKALSHNNTIEFLSMVGTGPPDRAGPETSELLSRFFETNRTLKFLDLSGYSGKLEDGHLGWGLSGALGGLKQNTSLRQLRVQNHDIGAAEDVTELCRVLVANRGLAMFDCRNNNFDHNQFAQLVHALTFNRQLISFPISDSDREYVVEKERRVAQSREGMKKGGFTTKAAAADSRIEGMLDWIRGYWDSEAKKAREVLARNREDQANVLQELDSEYVAAWDDADLPVTTCGATTHVLHN
ncbi:RNI-like protein [Xylariomycetidae sp. FL0641]|nr:RNI-like protein [Xylariomycetidae sp. FL0641]